MYIRILSFYRYIKIQFTLFLILNQSIFTWRTVKFLAVRVSSGCSCKNVSECETQLISSNFQIILKTITLKIDIAIVVTWWTLWLHTVRVNSWCSGWAFWFSAVRVHSCCTYTDPNNKTLIYVSLEINKNQRVKTIIEFKVKKKLKAKEIMSINNLINWHNCEQLLEIRSAIEMLTSRTLRFNTVRVGTCCACSTSKIYQ